MSFSYSNSAIEDLKNQINIVDVIGRVVPLKKTGSNHKGVCPFHNEKTPSFVVSEQKQFFTCFGCGAKGDAIEFVKRYYNLEFSEAVEKIATENGITLEKNAYDNNREIYYDINKQAASFFYKAFSEKANKGYSYMKNRGFDDNILKKYGVGYADEEWDSLYKYFMSKEVNVDHLVELGLVSLSKGKYYDKFRNRVIFPIISTNGKVIGFGGRAIGDDNPKYLNSAESKIFQKKNNLYGFNISRQEVGKEGQAILVEGYMDTVSLYQFGVRNVVASLGTALTENQAKLLKRYTNQVILSYDSDNAGQAATLRGLDILSREGCKVKVLQVDDGKDPDEFIRKNGKNAFIKLIDNALPLIDYKLENIKEGIDFSQNEGKIDYLKKATEILKTISPIENDIYIQKLSKELKISEGAIRMEILGKDSKVSQDHENTRWQTEVASDIETVTILEKNILKIVFTNDKYIEKVSLDREILQSDFSNKIFELVVEEYNKNNFIDTKKIMDAVDPKESKLLQQILDEVIIGGKEEQVYNDCLQTFRQNNLAKEEQELITLLSLADEENNTDKIRELTQKLIEVQKKKQQ
ncbi:MAG: DNA primase [Anaerovoracaceae bacterium]